ncbi:unnamed protein product [Durusdinium trenchii]|uniref:Ubiquitin-like domain-containing protein n=1 Tax=Durusdinium trenchii TaxID=1381693 RepID=A0ABP0PNV6_9DINO
MEGESTAKFIKLSGEEIPCVVPSGSTVREAAPLLQKFLPRGSLRLITETGKVLSGSDVIPSEGLLQVQVMSIAKGRWSSLYSAAFDGFDEAALRAALRQAWPGDFQRKGPEMGDLEDKHRLK